MLTPFTLLAAAGTVLGAVALWLVLRARKAAPVVVGAGAPAAPATGAAAPRWTVWLAAVVGYVRRLRAVLGTPVAQRYRKPWVILLGQGSGGKSSLIASMTWVRQHSECQAVTRPDVPMTAWHALPQGMLIDPDGRLSSAAPGTEQATQWQAVLDAIGALRPERALDGVLLVVTAASLAQPDPQARLALAQNARRQLDSLRERLGVVLPVYVVVTQCDAVGGPDGFGAFWRVLPPAACAQMQGWSAPGGLQPGVPAQWVAPAWTDMVARHKALQVQAAAVQSQIADADPFFLYPRHFEQLQAPARDYLGEVFHETAWDQAFLCRGIYFTGNVVAPAAPADGARTDIAFVDELFSDKVLRERGLARIAVQSVWSRNETLRGLQRFGLAAACVLSAGLCFAALQLHARVDALVSAINVLRQSQAVVSADACLPKAAIDDALGRAAAMDTGLTYLTMPLSWFDARASGHAVQAVSDTVLARTVLPALACGLQKRATALNTALPQPTDVRLGGIPAGGSVYARDRATLAVQAVAVQDLELNLARFARLSAVPAESAARKLQALNELSVYLYGAPLPEAALASGGTVAQALVQVPYTGAVALPPGMREHFTQQLRDLSLRLPTGLVKEASAGPTLLAAVEARLVQPRSPVVEDTRRFTAWLTWVGKSWLPSNPVDNPCSADASEVTRLYTPLVETYRYNRDLLDAVAKFAAPGCYQPVMDTLRTMKMSPYGSLVKVQGPTLVLEPALDAETRGLTALLAQSYMQTVKPQGFACLNKAPAWRTVDIGRAEGFAREYQQLAQSQNQSPLGAPPAQSPLFMRSASAQLEQMMNDALRAAQASAGAPADMVGLDAVAVRDQTLLDQSGQAAQSLQPLLAALRLYSQLGFGTSRGLVSQCARDGASDALGRVAQLAADSRLYEPPENSPDTSSPDTQLVSLGTTPVVRDYLARQVARAQVLAGYADPFASLLRNTDGLNDAQRDKTQTLQYWTHTLNELARYVQFKDPAGQVGVLDTLFLKTVADLTYANCGKTLAALQPIADGDDLFSSRRLALVRQLNGQCSGRRSTDGYEAYRRMAERFNDSLAGRYPFADVGQGVEAPAGTVKAFLASYDSQRAALDQALAGLDPARWPQERAFLAQLDRAAAFLRPSLGAVPSSQPVRLSVTFRALPAAGNVSPGSNQVVNWSLSAGARVISYPSLAAPVLDWPYGQVLALDMAWAVGSVWRPVANPPAPGFAVDGGVNASFTGTGDWALLRMIERYKPARVPQFDPLDPNRVLLEFTVPVVRTDVRPLSPTPEQAVLYLGLNLSGTDSKTQAPVALTWPGPFPRTAPCTRPQSKEIVSCKSKTN
jgi:type VI secretion system protein ImpL